ncbi:hypothetical protein SAMN05444166_6309 [Singulisphaera sp. GP187]|uniref:hypothetical protein n=1 Tax=Singulisphaera sp. GP187 TaxID=1882752 RepID=UPI000928B393|nr:hypothetical protein [Singulisphaera sp. GP187]SIO60212.1 hypothetical protein SAMN05444166_6309 [Singulisphaera sp. GP187]
MAKKKPTPKKPPAPRVLQGTLVVYETQTKLSRGKRLLASARLPGDLLYDIFIDSAELCVSLERQGFATRVVDLKDLVNAIFYAEERS